MFELEIITPERVAHRGRAVSLVAPGAKGLFGVLDHHAPLLNTLQVGVLVVRNDAGETHYFALGGGFLEVADNKVVVLADSAEEKSKINADRARKAKERAEGRLKDRSNPLIDQVRAEAALKRAINRLRAAQLT